MFVLMGANGNITSKAATILLKQGHKVKVIGRKAESLTALKAAGAELALGDASNADFLTQAFKGDGGTSMTRVSVALLKPAAYRVQIEGQTLRLSLTPSDATAPGSRPAKRARASATATPRLNQSS